MTFMKRHFRTLGRVEASRRALERPELRQPTVPREAPTSPTSFPIKKQNPADRALIDTALRERKQRSLADIVRDEGAIAELFREKA